MEKKVKLEAINKFFDQISRKQKPDVVCPECQTLLRIEGDIKKSYSVVCGTPDCFVSNFRGV